MTLFRPLAQQCLFQFSNSVCALQMINSLNVVLMCFKAEIEQCENSGGSCVRVVLVFFFLPNWTLSLCQFSKSVGVLQIVLVLVGVSE